MLSPEQFLAFLLAAALITAAPGPDNLMVLGIGMAKGRLPAVAFGLGCALGCLSHTLLAVLGVSALLAASPQAFTVLRVGGGLYLVWIGVNALRSTGGAALSGRGGQREEPRQLFVKGILANAINPKVILFFLSFLPQFVVPAHGDVGLQMALLGVIFTLQAALIFSLLGYFSGGVGRWLATRPRVGSVLDRLSGMLFIGLGLRLIVSR